MGDGLIKYFAIGKIINTHGLKGELKIYPTTDDINRFDLLEKVFINDMEYEIENVRYDKNLVYIKFFGIDDIDQAQKFKGCIIKIPEDLALPLEENEFYLQDLYGLNVYEGENFLGKITDIIQTGANDIYVVDGKLMIPAVKQFVLAIDTQNKIMRVKLIKGMRDLND